MALVKRDRNSAQAEHWQPCFDEGVLGRTGPSQPEDCFIQCFVAQSGRHVGGDFLEEAQPSGLGTVAVDIEIEFVARRLPLSLKKAKSLGRLTKRSLRPAFLHAECVGDHYSLKIVAPLG